MLLIVPALLAIWLMLRRAGGATARRARLAPFAAAVLFLATLAALALNGGNTARGRVAGRFAFDGDFRSELRRDTLFAVGLGGFQPAMLAAERLEVLEPSRPNRAHNDYLEFVLGGGLPAVLIGCAIMTLIAARAASEAARTMVSRPPRAGGPRSWRFLLRIRSSIIPFVPWHWLP